MSSTFTTLQILPSYRDIIDNVTCPNKWKSYRYSKLGKCLLLEQTRSEIFPATTGGASQMCSELSVPWLGSLPLEPALARCCDGGQDFLTELPNSPAVAALKDIVDKIVTAAESPSN